MTAAVPPPVDGRPYRVCFVCTGNICRSPMADVVLRHLAAGHDLPGPGGGRLVDRLEVSSAGTGPWHRGEPMDPRARAALAGRGYADHGHVARQFDPAWFDHLDLVVGLDRRHRQTLRSLAGPRSVDDRLVLLRQFDRNAGGAVDIADPYYDDDLFQPCLVQVEAACQGLAAALAAALATDRAEQPGV